MKPISKLMIILGIGTGALTLSGTASANSWVFVGPLWRPPVVVAAPPIVVVPPAVASSPPVYVESAPLVQVPAQPDNYWYYCSTLNRYYPYVTQCPGGWQRVVSAPH